MRDAFRWKINIFEFQNFQVFYYVKKNKLSILAVWSALVDIFSSVTNVIFSEDFILSDKGGFTVFLNLLVPFTFDLNFLNNPF